MNTRIKKKKKKCTFCQTENHNQLTSIKLILPINPAGTVVYPSTLFKVNHFQNSRTCKYLNSHLYISSPTLQYLGMNPTTQQQQIV